MAASGHPAVKVSIEAKSFGNLMREAKAFDKQLGLRLRKNIKKAAEGAVTDVKDTIQSGSAKHNIGIRAALAAGTRLTIDARLGGKSQGVRIVTSGSKLPPGHEAMLRLYNKPSFRHPVFSKHGKTKGKQNALQKHLAQKASTWVVQTGRPYFGSVINKHQQEIRAAVEAALQEASTYVGNGRP